MLAIASESVGFKFEKSGFRAGDKVRHISGGKTLTVERIDGVFISCLSYGKFEEMDRHLYHYSLLQKAVISPELKKLIQNQLL